MGFLVPAFLVGLAALAVPLLLHLRQRDRDRPQPFPSFMFLEQLTIRTDQRQRVSDWPLLLLRALALLLLVLAFSRPLFRGGRAGGADARRRAVVLLVDRSQSMGYAGVWAHALDSARAVIAGLGRGDRVAVVAYDDAAEVLQRLTTDKASATGSLARLAPRSRGTRLAPALRTARQLLLDAPFAAAEIVVVSDLQRAGAVGVAGVELPTGVTVRGVRVGPDSWANSTIQSVDARRVANGDRTLLAIKARVQSHGLTTARDVAMSLVLNGRDAAVQRTTLRTDGETVVTFEPVPAPDGAVALRVALPPDALTADDTLTAVVPRDDQLPVSLTGSGAGATMFFERALAIGRAPVIRVGRSIASGKEGDAVRVYWDRLPDASAEAFVQGGGGVVIVAGPSLATGRGAPPAFVPARFGGLTDRLSDRGGTLRDVRTEHPLFAMFREAPDALGAVRLWRYARLEPVPSADVLARFDDGQPAVLEQRVGKGRVLLLALPLDNTAGDFPLQPAFLPFVRQLMLHASGRDAAPLWRGTGDRWALSLAVTSPVIAAPDGALLRPTADSMGSAVSLADAGLYRVYAEQARGEPVAMVAANVPSSESVLTPMDTTELLLGVRTGTTDSVRAASNAPVTDEELERRQSPWRVLLIIAGLLLAIETWVASRGRRGTARRRVPSARSVNNQVTG